MAILYNVANGYPNWISEGNQILNFKAGEDIPAKAFVVRDSSDPHTMYLWTGQGSVSGYAYTSRTTKAGCNFDAVTSGYDLPKAALESTSSGATFESAMFDGGDPLFDHDERTGQVELLEEC